MAGVVQLEDDVGEEVRKFGTVAAVLVPRPPAHVDPSAAGRAYVQFMNVEDCKKAQEAFQGRQFDGNTVTATCITPDQMAAAQAGLWNAIVAAAPASAPTPAPGVYMPPTTKTAPWSKAREWGSWSAPG